MPSNPNRAPSHTPAARAVSRASLQVRSCARAYARDYDHPDQSDEQRRTTEAQARDLERAALRYAAAVARAAAEGAKR